MFIILDDFDCADCTRVARSVIDALHKLSFVSKLAVNFLTRVRYYSFFIVGSSMIQDDVLQKDLYLPYVLEMQLNNITVHVLNSMELGQTCIAINTTFHKLTRPSHNNILNIK